MCTAAQLGTKFSHLYHADYLPVFLPKESHGTSLLRLFDGHLLCHHRETCLYLLVDNLLYLLDLLRCHRGEMCEVKTKLVWIYQRALLLHMVTQHQTQRLLHQMGGTVVAGSEIPPSLIYREICPLTSPNDSLFHSAHMANLRALELYDILNDKTSPGSSDHTCIRLLSAHGGVHRSLLYKNRTLLSCHQFFYNGIAGSQHGDTGFMG